MPLAWTIGPWELLVILGMCAVPVFVVMVVLLIVLATRKARTTSTNTPPPPKDRK